MERSYYEMLWYTEARLENYKTVTRTTEKAIMNYYNAHKNDADKYGIWVTKRDREGWVVRDLVWEAEKKAKDTEAEDEEIIIING